MIDIASNDNASSKHSQVNEVVSFDSVPSTLTSRQSGGKYNKSIDFDRHCVSPRRTKAGVKGANKGKENVEVLGDSYATLGESFMGESFANLSVSMFALGDFYDSENDDDDNQLENIVSQQITQKSVLDSIVDFEDDENDDDKSKD
jgi:hypothetical protein